MVCKHSPPADQMPTEQAQRKNGANDGTGAYRPLTAGDHGRARETSGDHAATAVGPETANQPLAAS